MKFEWGIGSPKNFSSWEVKCLFDEFGLDEKQKKMVETTETAMKKEKRVGKFNVLSSEQIWCTAGAVWNNKYLLSRVDDATKLLDLALDYYFSGCNVSRKLELFEKLNNKRVILSGHGCYDSSRKVTVPYGKKIFFYCKHREALKSEVGQHVEGFTGKGTTRIPVWHAEGGKVLPEYFLGFPGDLLLNLRGAENQNYLPSDNKLVGLPDNYILNLDSNRWIPLSILLNDSRVKRATEIHWCACRVRRNRKMTKLKGSYLYNLYKSEPGYVSTGGVKKQKQKDAEKYAFQPRY